MVSAVTFGNLGPGLVPQPQPPNRPSVSCSQTPALSPPQDSSLMGAVPKLGYALSAPLLCIGSCMPFVSLAALAVGSTLASPHYLPHPSKRP